MNSLCGVLVSALTLSFSFIPATLCAQQEATSDLDVRFAMEWLVLGPFPRDQGLDAPVGTVGSPFEGQEVTLASGEKRTWKKVRAGRDGIVRLDRYCKQWDVFANDVIYYAYAELALPVKHCQTFLGMDDGARMWVDGRLVVDDRKPDWFHYNEHSLSLERQKAKPIPCVLELHNWEGAFYFSVSYGYTLELQVVHPDGMTPVPHFPVLLRGESSDFSFDALTDAQGSVLIPSVPYRTPLTRGGTDESIDIPTLELKPGEAVTHKRHLQLPLPGNSSLQLRELKPHGSLVAIAEQDGRIIAANERDGKFYVWDGTWNPHPNPRLQNVTNGTIREIAVQEQTTWIATEEDGLYRVTESQTDHWPLSGENSKLTAFYLDVHGNAWIGVRSGNKAVGKLYRIEDNSKEQIEVAVELESLVRDIAGNEAGRIVILQSRGPLWQITGETMVSIPVPDKVRSRGSVAMGHDGSLWIAASSLYRLTANEGWAVALPWGFSYEHHVVIGRDGAVWALNDDTVFLKQANGWKAARLPESIYIAPLASETGTLCLLVRHQGIFEASPTQVQVFDRRDGLQGSRGVLASPCESGVILTADQGPAIKVSEGKRTPIPFPKDWNYLAQQPYFVALTNGELVLFNNLSTFECGVFCFRFAPYLRSAEGKWKRLTSDLWGDTSAVFHFCQVRSDGTALIGTQHGLVTIHDGQLVRADVIQEPRNINAVLECEDTAEAWMTEWFGDLHRVKDGKIVETIQFADESMTTCLVKFHDRLWIGRLDGLFHLDRRNSTIERFENSVLDGDSQIAGMTVSRDGELLYIATQRQGIYTLDKEGLLLKHQDLAHYVGARIRSIATDKDGKIWVSGDDGTLSYVPRRQKPMLFLSHTSLADGRLNWRDPLVVRASSRDANVRFRYRVDAGNWELFDPPSLDELSLRVPAPGRHTVEISCIDSDHNVSNSQTIAFETYVPIIERPRVQRGVAVALMLLGFATLGLGLQYLTTRSRLLSQEQQARRQAEASIRERELLLGRVCHDLRNPLHAVSMCTELLDSSEAENLEIRALLAESTGSMRYLTDQLLTYSKSLSNSSVRQEAVDIESFFLRLETAINVRYGQKPVDFGWHIAPELPRFLVTDEAALREMVENLIDNAFRHTLSGKIELLYRGAPGGHLDIAVKDSGSGMDRSTVERLFEPYFQGDSSGDGMNVGLGMAICQQLARKLGAEIVVESKLNVGSQFSIRFKHESGANVSISGLSQGVSRRVMIIDDEPAVRKSVVNMLEEKGHKVQQADDSVDAETISNFSPEIVIIDMRMPNRTGTQVCRMVRQLGSPHIVATSSSKTSCEEAIATGSFDETIAKEDLFGHLASNDS